MEREASPRLLAIMNYFSTTFLVSLLLLWLGGSHVIRQLKPDGPSHFPQQTLQRTLPRS